MARLSSNNWPRPNYIARILNTDAEEAPAAGIIEYYGTMPNGRVLLGRKPKYPGITRIAILPERIPPGEEGPCLPAIGTQALCYCVGGVGARMSCDAGSWVPVLDAQGPLLVVQILDDSQSPAIGLVTITDDVASPKIVARADGTLLGAFRTIIYAGERGATNPMPAKALVS
ncbi:MAG: hypothetical protein BWX86_00544 [Verrucomicrobia bacterium ADurb.Bin122]|nr:MAG: hypothetical protein BWX86_00544 [Verrucomicrobia bacterium ADurb.Bin122]